MALLKVTLVQLFNPSSSLVMHSEGQNPQLSLFSATEMLCIDFQGWPRTKILILDHNPNPKTAVSIKQVLGQRHM
jgi:hypothetical protein